MMRCLSPRLAGGRHWRGRFRIPAPLHEAGRLWGLPLSVSVRQAPPSGLFGLSRGDPYRCAHDLLDEVGLAADAQSQTPHAFL